MASPADSARGDGEEPVPIAGDNQLDIVIVNWNAGHVIHDCLSSIFASRTQACRVGQVVVVDNASVDGSPEEIRRRWRGRVHVLENTENVGFGRACNEGAMECRGKWLLFLNPDTRLYQDTLEQAVAELVARGAQGVGVVGVALEDSTGRIARSCARFPTWKSFGAAATGLDRIAPRLFRPYVMAEWTHDSARLVNHVIGAFYLLEHAVFRRVGGFDERFFLYLEDLDLSLRIAGLGYGIYYTPRTSAFHAGGGTSRRILARRLFLSQRSRLQYARKHFRPHEALLVLAMTVLVEPFVRLVWSVVRGQWRESGNVLKAYGLLVWDLLGSIVRSPGRAGSK
jgi:GT2 family glycosyltransferase